ncbi:calcium-translocating P-type ATPase, PMCA-type [Vulgatibacter sp.]|uniref:calcium-translocating P-type ATPase, PMCA-type n=1 Tax=Vulgatibacter sp. TaxID=1971226 RepID=UPI0035698B3B
MNTDEAKAPTWCREADEVLASLASSRAGLGGDEAASRLASHGPNRLPRQKGRSALSLLLAQFKSLLVLILVGAALLALAVGDLKDAIVIGFVVVLNTSLGFFQEYRAEKAVAALEGMLAQQARVRREGRVVALAAEQVVPGDIVLVEAGDRLPADGRLVEVQGLEVDESALTGESVPVPKQRDRLDDPELGIGDRSNLGWMNTVATRGKGELVVTATGAATEMGRIASLLERAEESPTPLQKQVDILGKRLALIAGVVVVIIAVAEWLRGTPPVEILMSAVALAVAAIPEGLPAVVTVTLALGMRRMAQRRAIVKRMSAVETLGSTSDICTDKTGTLTVNQMTVRRICSGVGHCDVTGEGYTRDGEITGERGVLEALIPAVVLCNDSDVRDGKIAGDPMEAALLILAEKAGADPQQLRKERPRVAEIPFDSLHKFMATFHEEEGRVRLFVKGAPDVLFERSAHAWTGAEPAPIERESFTRQNEELASEGLRVIAVATRLVEREAVQAGDEGALHDLVQDLTWLGLVGLVDPPRPEAKEAIARCKEAGIRVRMITGDHVLTGSAIARELGIEGEGVRGAELERMDDAALRERVPNVGVFARVSPDHKLRIVRALQARDGVVAMIGDGVNDAPALRTADIGVAMGITGTDVTREAARMVLADDNFATIVGAVRQGRAIYDNIVKFLRFQLSTNIGAILVLLFAPILGLPIPFTPVQILWVNLIMDGPPAMALGVDPPAPGIMQEKPRSPTARILTLGRFVHLAFFGAIMATGTLFLFVQGAESSVDRGRTMAFTTFVLFQFFNVFNARALRRTAFTRHALRNRALWIALALVLLLQVAAVELHFLNRLLSTTPLTSSEWLRCIAVASSVLLAEELRKLLWPRRRAAA